LLTSYHNHTDWSDGECTLAEQIAAARLAGLDELGISDHYLLYPGGKMIDWSMEVDRLGEYVAEIKTAAAQASGVTIRLGLEADFFPETVEELRRVVALHPFDYIIGSVHFTNNFPIDENTEQWDALTEEERNEMWRLYWVRIRQMAESGVFDFAAHLDLPKKFGHRPTVGLTAERHAALDALAAADMAIEINTAGWYKPANEAYPTLEILREARSRDIPLLINSDAHSPEHLTRDFDRAYALAREAGYAGLVRYEGRKRYPVPIPLYPPTQLPNG
jgi:histidinol-phosphatase (PHP family)